MPSERELVAALHRHEQALADGLAACKYWHQKALTAADATYAKAKATIEQNYQRALADARARYEQEWLTLKSDLDKMPWPGFSALAWDSSQWEQWGPDSATGVPQVTRLGELLVKRQWNGYSMPALAPLIGTQNLLFVASGAAKERARLAIESIVLRLLATIEPGKLRLVCIDPVGLGATVAGFIKDLPDTLTGGQAWFDATHIERQLADLEAHMAMVKQKYLGVRYASMEDYNRKAGEVAEPYRLLVVSDFPARFSDSAVQRLVSIATNGPATGVHVLAMIDADQKSPYNFSLGDLERTATVIAGDDTSDIWRVPHMSECSLMLDQPPATELFERIVQSVGQAADAADKVQVPFARYVPPKDLWWQGDSRAGIVVPIGRSGAEGVQRFELDEEMVSSALVIGRTGSGKSTLLHSLILSLAMRYSPSELELYLLDLKQVEFEDYASHALPHARVVGIQSEREFGLSVLRGIGTELQRRKDLFTAYGSVNLREYRDKSGAALSRILLIVDEFQDLFSEDDATAREAATILDSVVRTGRAFGVNTLLASQTLAGPRGLERATKDQVPIRIALQCADADSRLVLSDDNSAAQLLERPGEAIYNASNGRVEGNRLFQVSWLTSEEREGYLRAIRDRAARDHYTPPNPQIVFRGNVPARIAANRQLGALLNGHGWPEPLRAHAAWLGEPVEIKAPTAAVFRRQSRSNLLVIGQNQNESAAVAMLLTALVSLAAQHWPAGARFAILNLTDVDAAWHDLPAIFASSFPHEVRVARRREAVGVIQELADELDRRLAETDDERWPALYLTVLGLHRARDLRMDEADRYRGEGEPVPPVELLARLCREGPDVGIHVLIWCDTHASLERALDRGAERHFDMRVALQMSAEESRRLLDSDAASTLGAYRAIYYDEDRTGRPERFRPYELPTQEQIAAWGQTLGARA